MDSFPDAAFPAVS